MERKRQDAPGDLEHVRAFVNTLEIDEGRDDLASGAALARWLVERDLAPPTLKVSRRDLEHAVELREALRGSLLANNEGVPTPAEACRLIDRAALRGRLNPRFDAGGGPLLEPAASGVDGALGRLLAIVHEAVAHGTWPRLKACREETCQWAFYDHTKNRSGSWCTMQVCGNRAKARAYRQRRKSKPDA
jgi:predicted RNA-binding Zn ribbon-like protein